MSQKEKTPFWGWLGTKTGELAITADGILFEQNLIVLWRDIKILENHQLKSHPFSASFISVLRVITNDFIYDFYLTGKLEDIRIFKDVKVVETILILKYWKIILLLAIILAISGILFGR